MRYTIILLALTLSLGAVEIDLSTVDLPSGAQKSVDALDKALIDAQSDLPCYCD